MSCHKLDVVDVFEFEFEFEFELLRACVTVLRDELLLLQSLSSAPPLMLMLMLAYIAAPVAAIAKTVVFVCMHLR